VEVVRPVRPGTVGGQPSATVVLKLTREGTTYYLERALVYAPSGKAAPMVRLEALLPASSWQSPDHVAVDSIVASVRSG
jgi:hypothetical protein